VSGILDAVDVAVSARKHGIADADILHAWRNVLRCRTGLRRREQAHRHRSRRDGALLELVLVPDDAPTRVIHADHVRRSFLDRLR